MHKNIQCAFLNSEVFENLFKVSFTLLKIRGVHGFNDIMKISIMIINVNRNSTSLSVVEIRRIFQTSKKEQLIKVFGLFRKGDLKMPEQHYLLDSMIWQIILYSNPDKSRGMLGHLLEKRGTGNTSRYKKDHNISNEDLQSGLESPQVDVPIYIPSRTTASQSQNYARFTQASYRTYRTLRCIRWRFHSFNSQQCQIFYSLICVEHSWNINNVWTVQYAFQNKFDNFQTKLLSLHSSIQTCISLEQPGFNSLYHSVLQNIELPMYIIKCVQY